MFVGGGGALQLLCQSGSDGYTTRRVSYTQNIFLRTGNT